MAGKQRQLRKRKALEELDEPHQEAADVPLQDKLAVTKLLQKQRARTAGVDATALALGSKASGEDEEDAEEVHSEMLEAYVREQVKETGEKDPHMEKYIREQMAKRLGKDADEADGGDKGPTSAEDDLYKIPDNLKVQQSKQADPSAWMTGILEVQLPVEYKMRNIEETEAAKKRMLAGTGPSADDEEGQRSSAPVARRGIYPRDFGRSAARQLANKDDGGDEDAFVANLMRQEYRQKKKSHRH